MVPWPGPAETDPLFSLRDLMAAYSRALTGSEPRTIAVVGNAPLSPSTARAGRIDGCELVIRVNSFVTDRTADSVAQGALTDVVLFSRSVPATPDFFRDYRRRLYVMLEPMRMFRDKELWPASWPRDLGYVVARNDAVAIPLSDEIGLPWRGEALAPTTGTTAVWLARRVFPNASVMVTGLSFLDDPGQTAWQHQWGDSVRVGPEHRIRAEAAMLRRWRDEGYIEWFPC